MSFRGLLPDRWPITVKIPAVVALFMAAVSAIITNTVLDRLTSAQQRHFESLADVYLDALSSALVPFVLREDTWEIFDALDRASSLGSFGKVQVVVADDSGTVLASTDPRNLKPGAPLPTAWSEVFRPGSDVTVDVPRAEAKARRGLTYQGRPLGTINASFDISNLLRERREVLQTLMVTNTLLALALMTAAYWAVRRMVAPIRVLSTHLDRSLIGPVEPVQARYVSGLTGDYARLFKRFNAMAAAVNEREALGAQLANEERLASLGRLASGMAHEINNPLGGLFNALNSLRRHGHNAPVRERSLDLLERGLSHIRNVVRAALVTYKAENDDRALSADDIEDLRLLIEPEVGRKALQLNWRNEARSRVPVPAGLTRQATLNLLLNAVEASPAGTAVSFQAIVSNFGLHVCVADSGPGLDPAKKAYLETEGDPPPPEGDGLGIWIIRRLVTEAHGRISVETETCGAGSRVNLTIPFWPSYQKGLAGRGDDRFHDEEASHVS